MWIIDGLITDRDSQSSCQKTCLSATLSITDPTWTDLELNLGLMVRDHRLTPEPWHNPVAVFWVVAPYMVSGVSEKHNAVIFRVDYFLSVKQTLEFYLNGP